MFDVFLIRAEKRMQKKGWADTDIWMRKAVGRLSLTYLWKPEFVGGWLQVVSVELLAQ